METETVFKTKISICCKYAPDFIKDLLLFIPTLDGIPSPSFVYQEKNALTILHLEFAAHPSSHKCIRRQLNIFTRKFVGSYDHGEQNDC